MSGLRRPTVGRQVHYVSYGTPGGEYPSACRAADVTEVHPDDEALVGLLVKNPTGLFFHALSDGGCRHHGGDPDINAAGAHCNAGGRAYPGGSWHWPEVV